MQYTKKDRLRFLYKDGFPEDSDEFIDNFFDTVYKEENAITLNVGEDILSCAHIVMKKLNFEDRIIDAPYLVAVSTLSPLRGKGAVKPVIKNALDILYDRHMPFVLLYPFKHDYYKQYGFVTIDKEIDTKSVDFGAFNKVKSNNIKMLLSIFNESMRSYDISISRDVEEMTRRINAFYIDSDEIYILYKNGKIAGYALNYGDNVEELVLTNNSILDIDNLQYKDNVMGRLCHIPTALNMLSFGNDVNIDCILNVQDAFFGDSKVHLKIESGVVTSEYVERLNNSMPNIDITIEQLTLFIFGKADIEGISLKRNRKVFLIDKY